MSPVIKDGSSLYASHSHYSTNSLISNSIVKIDP